LPLKLLIDEDAQSKLLLKLLRKDNYDVITVNEVNLMGQSDRIVFEYARNNFYSILTFNCDDFEELHTLNLGHSGILVIYQGADRAKNMTSKEIVSAIANIEAAQISIPNQFIILNYWNY